MLESRIIRGIHIDWSKIDEESYLKSIPAISSLKDLTFEKDITFFVGENGTGKSTLLEAIAVAYGFNPEGGTINFRFSTYNDVSELGGAVRLSKGIGKASFGYFFRAESFFNLSTKAEEYDSEIYPGYSSYGHNNLHSQSHGESFLAFFQKYNGKGLYIMDEPEAALSPQRQLTLLMQIVKMAQKGSQFIIVSHSPIMLGIPGADIISFDGGELHRCEYEDTESYQVTEMFINNRKALLNQLLRE